MKKTVDAIVAAGADVWLVDDVPAPGVDVPRALSRACVSGASVERPRIGLGETPERAAVRAAMHALRGPRVTNLDPYPLLTDKDGLLQFVHDGQALFADQNHLSAAGAQRLEPLFEKALASSVP